MKTSHKTKNRKEPKIEIASGFIQYVTPYGCLFSELQGEERFIVTGLANYEDPSNTTNLDCIIFTTSKTNSPMKTLTTLVDLDCINRKFNEWVELVGSQHKLVPTKMNVFKYTYRTSLVFTHSYNERNVSGIFMEIPGASLSDTTWEKDKNRYTPVNVCLN